MNDLADTLRYIAILKRPQLVPLKAAKAKEKS